MPVLSMQKYRALTSRRGPSPALSKAQSALSTARQQVANLRARAVGKGNLIVPVASVIGGSAVGGAAKAIIGEEVLGVDSRLALGAAAVAVGVFVLKGKTAEAAILAGAGCAGVAVADIVEGMVAEATG